MKRVFALTGRPGSGKSFVARQFREWEVPIVEYGKEMKKYYQQYDNCPDSTWDMAEALREEYGGCGPAVCASGALGAALTNNNAIVLDGVRNTDELTYIEGMLPCKTHLIAVEVDYDTRLQRFYERGNFSEEYESNTVAMDVAEYRMNKRTEREEEAGLSFAMNSALHKIDNSGPKEETSLKVAQLLDEFDG